CSPVKRSHLQIDRSDTREADGALWSPCNRSPEIRLRGDRAASDRFSGVVPKADAIAGAIDCEIIELHSHGSVGVERNAYVLLKPKDGGFKAMGSRKSPCV